jgi:preprotein translocase subunit SecA
MTTNSTVHHLPIPGPLFGAYPQRLTTPDHSRLGKLQKRLGYSTFGGIRPVIHQLKNGVMAQERFGRAVRARAEQLPACNSQDFARSLLNVRALLAKQGFQGEALELGLAHSYAVLKTALGIALYDTQISAAKIMLGQTLAEMATGEGKTFAMFAAASVAALAGVPVHVVTANEYLAQRDAQDLAPAFALLGLSVTALHQGVKPTERVPYYAKQVVYGAAKEFIFDYLLDRSASLPGRATSMRGLCLALIDEADAVLIDEARTPFILAAERSDPHEAQAFAQALQIAKTLSLKFHYALDSVNREVILTDSGKALAREEAAGIGGLWANHSNYREELVSLALTALHLYRRDVDYVLSQIKDQEVGQFEVELIDINTGRIATGRKFSNGLHQLLEIKEACKVTSRQHTIAQLTFQRFFTRYHRLGGMSGTVREAAREIARVYGIGTTVVPLRVKSQRRHGGVKIYTSQKARWRAVITAIRSQHLRGRPVLVGTDSVADSEHLSALLRAAKIQHQVLNATQSEHEAALVARAGEPGCVTVATNMAGRGTDIKMVPRSLKAGGLHVVSCQLNSELRIDRQLHGRCARQGDPGSVETILGLQEGLFERHLSASMRATLARLGSDKAPLNVALAGQVFSFVQRREQALATQQRARVAKQDEQNERQLAVSGTSV